MSENPADALIRMGQQARLIQTITPSKKARQLAEQAVKHATGGLMHHNDGNFDGANRHAGEAAKFLQDAAKLHVSAILKTGETPAPQDLDVAHLGEAQKMHEDYLAPINEGKNNGSNSPF